MNLTDSEAVRRARRFRDLERRLFEVMGGWVREAADPELKLILRAQSFQHAWHADLWANLIPPGLEEGRRTVAGRLEEGVEAMAEAADTVARVAAAYEVVLPELMGTYRGFREAASSAADGPLVRALTLMLADDVAAAEAAAEAIHRGLAQPEPIH